MFFHFFLVYYKTCSLCNVLRHCSFCLVHFMFIPYITLCCVKYPFILCSIVNKDTIQCMHARMHVGIVSKYTYMLENTHIHTCIHTYIQTYIHTYIDMYVYVCIIKFGIKSVIATNANGYITFNINLHDNYQAPFIEQFLIINMIVPGMPPQQGATPLVWEDIP